MKRRIRRIDYISRFVDAAEADPERHVYARDNGLIEAFKTSTSVKLEFVRPLLSLYSHAWEFEMPEVIKMSSAAYISENDPVDRFVREHIVKDRDAYFTLEQARTVFSGCEYFNRKAKTFKNDLQKRLGGCYDQKKMGGRKLTNVFVGYRLVQEENEVDDLEA